MYIKTQSRILTNRQRDCRLHRWPLDVLLVYDPFFLDRSQLPRQVHRNQSRSLVQTRPDDNFLLNNHQYQSTLILPPDPASNSHHVDGHVRARIPVAQLLRRRTGQGLQRPQAQGQPPVPGPRLPRQVRQAQVQRPEDIVEVLQGPLLLHDGGRRPSLPERQVLPDRARAHVRPA